MTKQQKRQKKWHKNDNKIVLLKYLSNFWKFLEMPLINYEINLILTWPENCPIKRQHSKK